MGLFESSQLTFPHFHDRAPSSTEALHFLLAFLLHIGHGSVSEMQAMLVTNRIAGGTAVPEAAVKFVHSVGVRMEAINGERGAGHVMLTCITYLLNVMTAGGMRMIQVTVSHQVVHLQIFCDGLGLEGLTAKLMIAIHPRVCWQYY